MDCGNSLRDFAKSSSLKIYLEIHHTIHIQKPVPPIKQQTIIYYIYYIVISDFTSIPMITLHHYNLLPFRILCMFDILKISKLKHDDRCTSVTGCQGLC